ncbi:hypothetical protein LSH36_1456g00000 [Paralvinella palmiformis]|uniref:Uncharacterized protein n=1 Tax=Paralvinella palmiformis TaxID=53620 RepID=A0AAD9ISN6_9ANNE|nr:hypothetical protein LSH36_1456g00000 [Paralvinella palmiformis]
MKIPVSVCSFLEYSRLILFLMLGSGIWLTQTVQWNEYKDYSGKFTAFPHNIALNVNLITISYSHIPVIDYIEPFPLLYILTLQSADLSEIPDLSNISNVLQHLFLGGNNIKEIESFTPMTTLRTLELSKNLLTIFPNLTCISSCLWNLDLSKNNFETLENIPLMSKLRSLTLDDNKLVAFPDLRNLSSSLEKLYLTGNLFSKVHILDNLPVLKVLKLGGSSFTEFPDLTEVSISLEELYISNSKTYGKVILSEDVPRCNLQGFKNRGKWSELNVVDLLSEPGHGTFGIGETIFRRLESITWGCPFAVDAVFYNSEPIIKKNLPVMLVPGFSRNKITYMLNTYKYDL